MKKHRLNKKLIHITTIVSVVVISFFVTSCNENEQQKIDAIRDRTAIPKLHATDITTLVSDSGITRYRISTPQWDVFDRAMQPYWEFPMGINLERFNEQLVIDANIRSNYAKYLSNERLWELRGNVKMTNLKGELFETEQLFWSQPVEKIYSDSVVKITRSSGIINVMGFESNQQMTRYTFKRTTAVIPVSE